MTHTNTKTLIAASALFAATLTAAPALSADNPQIQPTIATSTQTSIPVLINDVPELIVPLDIHIAMTEIETVEYLSPATTEHDAVLSDMPLFEDEDSALYIGVTEASRFDTEIANQRRAAMPKGIHVEPLVPLASAGLKTTF